VKVQIAEKHPSGAKARRVFSDLCGTSKELAEKGGNLGEIGG
jgi:hypothetical protein